jgi:hypothetical protein
MKLHTKPQNFTIGINELQPQLANEEPLLKKECRVNGKTEIFMLNRPNRTTKRVYFQLKGILYFVDDEHLYEVVKNCNVGSPFLDFFFEAPQL